MASLALQSATSGVSHANNAKPLFKENWESIEHICEIRKGL